MNFMNFIGSFFENSIESLSIELDRTNQTYYPNEKITGHLIFKSNAPIDGDKLSISFIGNAKTLIENTQIMKHNDRNNHFQNEFVNAINGIATMVSSEHERNSIIIDQTIRDSYDLFTLGHSFTIFGGSLRPGFHQLPFKFEVPYDAPSTFKYQRFADIKYWIKADVDGKSQEISINIIGYPKIPRNKLTEPVKDQQSKTVGLLYGKEVKMRCNLSKSGWTLGTLIPINCYIDNHSDKEMKLSASIIQDLVIKAHKYKQEYSDNVHSSLEQRVPANCFNRQYSISISIPQELPIIQNTCRTILITYYIEVKLEIPFSTSLYCKLPIILTGKKIDTFSNHRRVTADG